MEMGIQKINISFTHSPVGTGNHSAFWSGGITKHAARTSVGSELERIYLL